MDLPAAEAAISRGSEPAPAAAGSLAPAVSPDPLASTVEQSEAIVTDNRRHFLAALRHGIKVETPAEFLAGLKMRRR